MDREPGLRSVGGAAHSRAAFPFPPSATKSLRTIRSLLMNRHATATTALLLFGGTLGTAHAGVSAYGGATVASSWCSMLVTAYNAGTGYSEAMVSATGNPVSGAFGFSDATYGVASCSAFTPSGVSITMALSSASVSGGASPEVTFRQAFTASTAMVMTWSGALPSGGGSLRIDRLGGSGVPPTIYWDGTNSVLNLDATAAGEYYLLSYSSFGASLQTGTALSVSFAEVPAPGALALLGAAGLVRGRRRH
jgi:MYXO-CTERM domain-containing protein